MKMCRGKRVEKMGSFRDREYEARLRGKERGGDAEAKDALNRRGRRNGCCGRRIWP